MRIEIPIVKRGKKVLIYNEGEYTNKISELKEYLNTIKPNNAEDGFVNNSISNLLKSAGENYRNSNGWVFSLNEDSIVFVKMEMIPEYHSFEAIAKQLI
jgi:hypothetical protein